jgi:aminoglycoside phosphotransferase (APT) family kinase protein
MIKVGTGRTAEVFRDDDGSAVKLFYDWMPATEAEHEAAILRSVSQVCMLAPKFYELVRIDDRNGLRFEFIDGEMAGQQMLHYPLLIIRLSHAIGLLHREIHSTHIKELQTCKDVFDTGIQASPWIDDAIRNKLLAFLHERKGNSLCHGDFHPENILIDKNGQMRVIDWVNAYSGDPLSDAARTYYLIRYGRSPIKRTLLQKLLERFGKALAANAYLRGYFGKNKLPKRDFRLWLLIIMINRAVHERIPGEESVLKKTIVRLSRMAGEYSTPPLH